jgi:hypothetical protein
MDNVTDAPKVALGHGKNALEKIPKPALAAVCVGVVGIVYWKKHSNSTSAGSGSAVSTNATPVADQGSTNQSYVPAGGDTISDPYGGYGNVGNYNTGLPPSTPVASGSSDTTGTSELGDISAFIGTLFPGGLPLGSGPVTSPLPGQGQSGQVSSAPQASAPSGVMVAPAPPTPDTGGVYAVLGSPTPAPTPAPAAAPVTAPAYHPSPVPAAAGTVTSRGTIIKVTHENGITCHYYAGGKKECFKGN